MTSSKFMALQMGIQSSLNQLTIAMSNKTAQMQQWTTLFGLMHGASPSTILAANAIAAPGAAAAPAIAGLAAQPQPIGAPAPTQTA